MPPSNPTEFLTEQYLKRKEVDPSYSLRTYAKDLGISVTQISRVLSGQREMTYRQMTKVLSALEVSSSVAEEIISGIILKAGKTAKIAKSVRLTTQAVPAKVTYHSMERFKLISKWYHLAVLELTYVKDFSAEPAWIASTLGISIVEARDALKRLIDLEFLKLNADGSVSKIDSTILFTPKAVVPEIVSYETTMLDKAKQALNQTDDASYQLRLINSITFPTSPQAIPELKAAIIEFQKSLFNIIKKHDYQDVYHFGCQLFPVSKSSKIAGKKI